MLAKRINEDGMFVEDVIIYDSTITTNSLIIEEDVPSGLIAPKWNGSAWVEGNTPLRDETTYKKRVAKLESIFVRLISDIKFIGIGNPYMKNKTAIDYQYETYEQMNEYATKGVFDTATNDEIIVANNAAKLAVAGHILFVNKLRGVLWEKIDSNDPDVDTLLSLAESLRIQLQDLTEGRLNEMKNMFGIL